MADQQVEPGDLLLRYYKKDGKRQFLYYRVPTELEGAKVQLPMTADQRVENLLGKRVRDEFVVPVGSADTFVKIHRIMKP